MYCLNFVPVIKTNKPTAKHADMSDIDVMNLYLTTRQPLYFDVFYSRYSILIFKRCFSLLKDEFIAEDACQEIFLKIILNFSSFKGKSKLSTWIYRITNNHCLDKLKKKNNQFIHWEDDYLKYAKIEDETYNDQNSSNLKTDLIPSVFDKIQSHYKKILLMKYEENLSIQEICSIIHKSESATKMQIKRARIKFKKIYHEN